MGNNIRTRKVAINAGVGLACHLANLLFAFINRYAFVAVLGTEYLGVKGLFTNVLTLLSLAELGMSSAIVFSLYKPLALGETEKIKTLMALYAKAFRTIGLVVAGAGLAFMPFLGILFSAPPDIPENIHLLFFLYLANSSLSYFFASRRNLIVADQRSYVNTLYNQGIGLGLCLGQIAILYLTGNFVLYLVLQIAATILDNLLIARRAGKDYPYLNEKDVKPLPPEEKQEIAKSVKALVLYKLGGVIMSGTDNIIITRLVGLAVVGLCDNYTLIITTVKGLLNQILNAFVASVGHSNAVESAESKKSIFDKLFLITAWIFGYLSIGMLLMFQEFIGLWLGGQYTLPYAVVLATVLYFYISGAHHPATTYRTTLGYFVQGRFAPLASALLNIVLSIAMGLRFGTAGILFATTIAFTLTFGIVDPVLIYRNCFSMNPVWYYVRYFAFFALFAGLYLASYWLLSFIALPGILGFLLRGAAFTLFFNAAMLLVFSRTRHFREVLQMALSLVKRKAK